MGERAICDRVRETLRSGGVEGDAFFERRRTLDLRVREGRLEDLARAEVQGLAVRAFREGRLGFVHTAELDPDGVVRAAKRAIEMARFGTQRDDLFLAEAGGPGDGGDEGEDLRLYDQAIEKKTLEEKESWVRTAEAAAREVDARITKSEGCTYGEVQGAYWMANTKGLYRHYRRTEVEVNITVGAEDQGEVQTGERHHVAVRWKDLPGPREFGRQAGERAIRLLGGRPVASGRYPVIFTPETGWTVLVYLLQALRGDHLSRGRSWLTERPNARIGSALVTVHDNGRHPQGVGSVPFDGEGVETRDTVLVEAGQVKDSLRDLASGYRLNLPSTGNAERGGYETLPEIAAHNLYLMPGAARPEDLLAEIEQGFWVWGLSGWWTGLDPANPQYSSAAYGLWIEKGKASRPVARVTVAGRLEEILQGVEAVASDIRWNQRALTPTFRVASLTVSGT